MAEYEVFEVCADDVKMTVTRFGEGEKIFIMLPGLSLTPVSQQAASVAGAYKKAAKDYTIYLFDRKQNPEEGYTVRRMAQDTAKIMEKLGLHDVFAFGASQGGMILQYLMIDNPGLVRRAVIGSSAAGENETSKKVIGEWIKLAAAHKKKELNHDCFMKIYSQEFLEKYKSALPVLEENGTEEDLDNFVKYASACDGFSAFEELDKIKSEVLVIGSACDKVVTSKASEEIASALGCELYIYDGYSHAVYDEAPDYLDRILEFFGRG